MTQEEKQLLLKDLCGRLPYGVKCRASYSKFPTTLVDVNADAKVGDDFFIVTVKLEKTELNSPSLIEDIRPYLRPMSSMTEEEEDELNSARMGNYGEDVDWLNAHHFDYRGLIPMGLALESLPGMYNLA